MLRKQIAIVLVAVFLLFGTGVAAAATKIAFVEVGKVLKESPKVKAAQEKIRKEFAQRDDQLVAEAKQLKKLKDKLVKDSAIMSEAEVKRLERDILTRTRKLKNSQSEFQEDVTLRQNEELGKLRKEIAEVIIEVAKKGGYDLVLESGVVWASNKVNITEQVLKALK